MYSRTGAPLKMLFHLRIHLQSSFFFDHSEATQWSESAKNEIYGSDMVIWVRKNAQHTRYSQPVTHVSTNPARPSLTSVIGRELVYSRRYDANRKTVKRNRLYIDSVLGKKRPKWALDGFKGVKSRVTSNLNALWNRMDHTIWSK